MSRRICHVVTGSWLIIIDYSQFRNKMTHFHENAKLKVSGKLILFSNLHAYFDDVYHINIFLRAKEKNVLSFLFYVRSTHLKRYNQSLWRRGEKYDSYETHKDAFLEGIFDSFSSTKMILWRD